MDPIPPKNKKSNHGKKNKEKDLHSQPRDIFTDECMDTTSSTVAPTAALLPKSKNKKKTKNSYASYIIPKNHIRKLIFEELRRCQSSNSDVNNNNNSRIRLSSKSLELIHMNAEAFLTELFSRTIDVLKLKNSKTLKKDVFKYCIQNSIKSTI